MTEAERVIADVRAALGARPEQTVYDAAVAVIDHAIEMEAILSSLLDAAERQAAGFPVETERWFAVRDAARAMLPEKDATATHAKGKKFCQQVNSEGYVCTREPGHDGPHIAHSMTGHAITGWDAEAPAREGGNG